MDDGPTEWEEDNAISFERQLVKPSHRRSVNTLDLGENRLDLHLDELTTSCVGNAEFQCGNATVGSNDRVTAVNDPGRGPRKTREDHSCGKCNSDDVEKRLDRDERVSGDTNRNNISIANCGKRIDAEKERAVEGLSRKATANRLKCVGPAKKKRSGEEAIDGNVSRCNESNELRPGDPQQPMVKAQRRKWIQPTKNDVECSVAIQESPARSPRNLCSEAEVFEFFLCVLRRGRLCVQRRGCHRYQSHTERSRHEKMASNIG